MQKIGILGVGELTEKIVLGWLQASQPVQILLSPRNAERARCLAVHDCCEQMPDNQSVVDAADILLIGVRPPSLPELAQEIKLRPEQTLISLVAGVSLSQLGTLFAHQHCVRLMLTFAAEIERSTVVLTPADKPIQALFAALGPLTVLENERDFELATVSICMNGWLYFFADGLQRWFSDKGMVEEDARRLVLGAMRDCAEYGSHYPDRPLAEMGRNIASEGTWTAQGQKILAERRAEKPWHEAADAVFAALIQSGKKS